MLTRLATCLIPILFAITDSALAQNSGRDAVLRVGMAQQDITPPIGMRLCGTFKERLSTGTHDPLMVRAIVFSQAPVTFAIAGCDLAMISPAVAAQARASIACRTRRSSRKPACFERQRTLA